MAIILLHELSYLIIQYLQQAAAIFVPILYKKVPRLRACEELGKNHPVCRWIGNRSVTLQKYHKKTQSAKRTAH